MNEKDIYTAKELLLNKRQLLMLIKKKETASALLAADMYIFDGTVTVRTSTLKELLDKELSYTNRRLKSLGVTEIT